MQQKIKILIACHRQYPVPAEPCYLPVEVGAALHPQPIPGFTPDNTGENISEKNTHYCELTASALLGMEEPGCRLYRPCALPALLRDGKAAQDRGPGGF